MRHVTQTCQWSVPTLFMPGPYWMEAWDDPWCCWNDKQLLVLTSTEICETCPMWKAREEDPGKPQTIPMPGAMPFKMP